MKMNYRFWDPLFCLLLPLLLLFPSNGFGQVISIDEFLQTNLASKQITQTFSYDCPDSYYTSTYSDKYLSITLSHQKTTNTDRGPRKVYDPYRFVIFNSQGELLNIQPEYEQFRIAGFLEGESDYYVLQQWSGNNGEVGVYDMEGDLVKPLNCGGYIYCSPTGKFYYHSGFESLLDIYDDKGDNLFGIPTVPNPFVATAVSDSTLLVFKKTTLSFWNIKTQKIIWESDIPGKQGGIVDDLSSHIEFSIPGNTIALRGYYGCYCFDFQGKFLWADEDYGFNKNNVEYMGVFKSSGDVVIIYYKFRNQHSRFAKFFNHEGVLLGEHEIKPGDDVKFAGTSSTAMVFDDYIFVLISVSINGRNRENATCILYKENDQWISALVSGIWYYLKNDRQEREIVGYDSNSRQVRGFQIK
jgi:hypothetical protein